MLLLSKFFILVILALTILLATFSFSPSNAQQQQQQQEGIEGYINPYHEVFTIEEYNQNQNKKNTNKKSSSSESATTSNALTLPGSHNSNIDHLSALPVARLRRFLTDREASCEGCVDKRDLIDRAVEVMTWPTRDDAIANDLSLEQDLMGPLISDLSIPIGEDRSPFQDQFDDETVGQNPSARGSIEPLSDEEVVKLLEIHRLRMLIADGIARCGPRMLNGTQYCGPAFAIVEKYSADK